MFGSNNDDKQKKPAVSSDALNAAMPDPINGPISPSASAVNSLFGSVSGAPEVPAGSQSSSSPSSPTISSFSTAPKPSAPAAEPASSPSAISSSADDNSNQSDENDESLDESPDDLIGLKQQALQQLSPLVSHLEQTPEEKFRTTMMMIQASDDQTLIKSAFEAAQKITDDKARAQALLDVINEINYFTQHNNSN